MPTHPSDPDARDWEQRCLKETRHTLARSSLLPNRSFHTIELEGEGPETMLVVQYTDVDGISETTRRFPLWMNPLYKRGDGSRWDPASVSVDIECAILER
jgi:hypothetical protein